MDHLAALGHKSVVYVSGPASSWSDSERQRGLRDGARDHHIEVRVLGPYIPDFQAGLNAADSALATGATAIVAYDDVIALGVITRLADRGVNVPGDVSVIGCDDIAAAGMYRPPLTTVRSSCDSAANAAIDHVRDWALGSNGKWVTMGIASDGQYGIPKDTMFGFPVTTAGGEYKLVEGLAIDAFSQERINLTLKELQEEQDGVKHLL